MKYPGPRMVDKETFILKSVWSHGDKYDYTKVEYKNKDTKVCIICPEHGEFWQRAGSHSQGKGCRACKYALHAKQTARPTDDVIEEAKRVHGGIYTYPDQHLKNNKEKLHIICNKHGSFFQILGNHINKKHGCPKCKGEKHGASRSFNFEIFISKATKIHGNKYDYSKVVYKNSNSPVEIICPEHGSFYQTPDSHWDGRNCPKCAQKLLADSQRYNKDIFADKARDVHGSKYDYSKVEYLDSVTKVTILCKDHGEFKTAPSNHLSGQGCPECANLRRGFGRSAIYKSFQEYSNIYLIRLYNDSEDFLKVGLARKPKVRHTRIKKETDYNIDILRCHTALGISVFDIEKFILGDKSLMKYVPNQIFQGYTECFSLESYDKIDEILEVCFDV